MLRQATFNLNNVDAGVTFHQQNVWQKTFVVHYKVEKLHNSVKETNT